MRVISRNRQRAIDEWANRFNIKNKETLEVFLEGYDLQTLCRPFIIEDLLNGVKTGMIQERYGVSYDQIRTIRRMIGMEKKPNRGGTKKDNVLN